MATINGTFNSLIAGTLSGTVATPGAQGPAGQQGPAGAQGPAGVGVPAGGLTNQFLVKTSNADFATGWTTLSLAGYATEAWVQSQGYITSSALTPYLSKAGNLDGLTNLATARDNLGLGLLSAPTFAGLTAQGSGSNVANLTSTSLTLNQSGHGQFTIQPSQGIVFPDTSVQTTAFLAGSGLPTGGTVGQVLTKNSGSNFDASFQTLIPGDRYLTTSTTTNTVSNGAKTFTVQTGLSYSSQQDVVISYDAANHMHARVTSYNSGTGSLVVDVQNHTGSGTYSLWTINVGGMVPATSVTWGSITGVLGNQSDLSTALSSKLEVSTAASTYQTIGGMSAYLTVSSAASTYLTQSDAASTYQTLSGMSDYLAKAGNLSGLSDNATARSNLGLGNFATVNDAPSDGSTYGRNNGAWVVAGGGGGSWSGGAITSPITYATPDGLITSTFSSNQIQIFTDIPSQSQTWLTRLNNDEIQLSRTYVDGILSISQNRSITTNSISYNYNNQTDTARYLSIDGNNTTSTIYYVTSTNEQPSTFTLSPSGLSFKTPSMSTAFTLSSSGIQFADGTTQSTAASGGGGGSPPYYYSVWAYGQWYSANASTVYDTSYQYINVLSF